MAMLTRLVRRYQSCLGSERGRNGGCYSRVEKRLEKQVDAMEQSAETYIESSDHEHWHLLDFERYELRRAGGRARRVTDRKTGFCLGDRYRIRDVALRAQPPEPRYTSRCGLGATGRLRLVEGISVGYGDDYPANLEGQSLPLAGLPAGRYVLIHRVNVQRRLRETDYGNNAASLLLRLQWRADAPRLRVLRRCPDTERCGQS